MVVPTLQLSNVNNSALNSFDIFSHIAIGSGTTTPSVSDTALQTELLRKVFDVTSVKDLGGGTYRFQMRVALSELNGSTLTEIGIFNQLALGGTLGDRQLLTVPVVKTVDKEIIIIMEISVSTINI